MPIYEFRCLSCGKEFEELVFGKPAGLKLKCPHCGGPDVMKKMSLFGMSGVEKPVSSVGGGGGSCGSCRSGSCGSCG